MSETVAGPGEAATPIRRSGLRSSLAALGYRNFRLFFVGAVISNSGTWAQNASVFFILERLTDSTTWAGFGSLMAFLPATLMGPLGGSIADRYHRRNVLLVTQSVQMVLSAALWLLWVSGRAEPWSVVAMTFASGLVGGTQIASWQAFITELVPRSQLLNAVTLNSTQFNIARGLGPLFAGLLIGLPGAGIGWALAVNPISYIAVLVALALIRVDRIAARTAGRPAVLRDFAEAVRYARRVPGIRICLIAIIFVAMLGSPIFSFLPKFNDDVYGASDSAFALLSAAQGLGGIAVSPFVGALGYRYRRSRLVVLGVGGYGAAVAGVGVAPSYGFGVAALLVAGAAYLLLASTLNTTIQLQVDESVRGKVIAFYVMCLTASLPIGAQVLGVIADQVGLRWTVGVAGAVLVGLTAALAASGRFAAMDDEAVPPPPPSGPT